MPQRVSVGTREASTTKRLQPARANAYRLRPMRHALCIGSHYPTLFTTALLAPVPAAL